MQQRWRLAILTALVPAIAVAFPLLGSDEDGLKEQDFKHTIHLEDGRQLRVAPFQWRMCGNSSDPLQITDASISPWPITFSESKDRTLTLGLMGNLVKQVNGGKLALKLKKKLPYVNVFEEIPCVAKFGSCTYGLCSAMERIFTHTCNEWFTKNKIPCKCPFNPTEIKAPASNFTLFGVGKIPTWLADGDFQAEITVTDENGNRVFCLWVQLSLLLVK